MKKWCWNKSWVCWNFLEIPINSVKYYYFRPKSTFFLKAIKTNIYFYTLIIYSSHYFTLVSWRTERLTESNKGKATNILVNIHQLQNFLMHCLWEPCDQLWSGTSFQGSLEEKGQVPSAKSITIYWTPWMWNPPSCYFHM